jgi:hypothetical protein
MDQIKRKALTTNQVSAGKSRRARPTALIALPLERSVRVPYAHINYTLSGTAEQAICATATCSSAGLRFVNSFAFPRSAD